jgi:hypothetical protein
MRNRVATRTGTRQPATVKDDTTTLVAVDRSEPADRAVKAARELPGCRAP